MAHSDAVDPVAVRAAKRRKRTAPPTPPTLRELERLYGVKLVAALQRQLDTLRRREREGAHGNRELFLSDLFVAQLLAFHLPIVRSLRTLEALSCTPNARRLLSLERLPRSTMSDAHRVVDPALLAPLMAELVGRLDGRALPAGLDALTRRLVAVDGTFLRVVGELLWALRQHTDNGKVVSKPRLDVQLDVAAGVPRFAVLSGHDRSECNAARLHIEPDKIYIADKAYFSFALLSDWLDAGADFVVALNSQIRFAPDHPPTLRDSAADERPAPRGPAGDDRPADRLRPDLEPPAGPDPPADGLRPDVEPPAADSAHAGNVLSDRLGRLPGCDHSRPPVRRLREVIVRRDNGEPLRLLTSLTDPAVTAEMIGEVYRRRWTIELFFRWLKSCAHFRHVISHSPNGLSLALYTAIIATLLTALATQRAPAKQTLAALSFVAAGMATWDDMQPVLERFERERAQARARYQARRRAAANNAARP